MNEDFGTTTILRLSESEALKKELRARCRDTIVHLTARCAGLLEVSNVQGTNVMGPDSSIVFFHRTARDFLYTDLRWSELQLAAVETHFNPSVSMMRSCISQALVNYCIYQKRPRRPTLEVELPICRMDKVTTDIAMDFLVYAFNGNKDESDAATQGTLFDQFDSIMDCSWINSVFTSLRGFLNQLEIASLFDLRYYLTSKIQQLAAERTKVMATDVLRYLLPEKDCHVKFGIPLPSIEMVSLLLALGADPNERGPSQSPWENTLQLVMETDQKSNRDLDKTFDLSFELPTFDLQTRDTAYDVRPLQLRYLEIMKMLVEAGADPGFCVKSYRNDHSYSALSVIERSLGRIYPIEVAPLLNVLREKLEAQETSRSRKRSRSIDDKSDKGRSVKRRQTKRRRAKKIW